MDQTDQELIRMFAETRDEGAFAELVRRHIDLVYGAACRVTGCAETAKDVTQSVFIDLARKAGQLGGRSALPAWLYRAALFAASKACRTEHRRQHRETEAMRQHELNARTESDGPDWLPLLDEALGRLAEADRQAILLRYLSRQDLRTVGGALGIGEDAARKRVDRAVERLRGILQQQGRAVPTPTVALALGVIGSQTAPPALAASVISAGLGVAPAAGLTLGLSLQAVLGLTFVAINGWVAYQDRELAGLRRQLAAERSAEVRMAATGETAPASSEAAELERLRSLANGLRSQLAIASAVPPASSPVPGSPVLLVPGAPIPMKDLQEAGTASPEAALQSMLAAHRRGDLRRVLDLQLMTTAERDRVEEEEADSAEALVLMQEDTRQSDARGDVIELRQVTADGPERVELRYRIQRPGLPDQEEIAVMGSSSAGWRQLPITIMTGLTP